MAADNVFAQNNVLQTDRLTLRPLENSDAEALWPNLSDPEISQLMAWEAHTRFEQTTDFVSHEISRRQNGAGITWAIIHNEQLCGIISLIGVLRSHRALFYNKSELAYWLATDHQGQGLMTEAGQKVLQYAFREIGLHKIYVSHFSGNEASRALILRLGFRYVGTQKAEFQKDGVWHDHVMYELLETEIA